MARRTSLALLATAALLAPGEPAAAGDGDEGPRSLAGRGRENLAALGKLLGYVRHFHPSDQAASAPWDAITVEAVRLVEPARDPEELATLLERVVGPHAPTVRVVPEGVEAPVPEAPNLGEDVRTVSWHHLGYGASRLTGDPYESRRIDDAPVPPGTEVFVGQEWDAAPWRGMSLRVSLWARAGYGTAAWLSGFVESPGRRPVPSLDEPKLTDAWSQVEIGLDVPASAATLHFGVKMLGSGRVFLDDGRVDVLGDAGVLPPGVNLDMEAVDPGGTPPGWAIRQPDPRIRVLSVEEGARTGRALLVVSAGPEPGLQPLAGEPLRARLPGGVEALVPLAVLADRRGTLPRVASFARPAPPRLPGWTPTACDRATRLAAVLVAWGVLRHFYPYDDVVSVDWDGELARALERAAEDPDAEAFHETLDVLAASLKDGHAHVSPAGATRPMRLPLRWRFLGDDLVITAVSPACPDVARGDVVRSIDGTDVAVLRARLVSRVSSPTPQWAAWRVAQELLSGPEDVAVTLRVEGASGTRTAVLRRSLGPSGEIDDKGREAVSEAAPGIWYVDLDRADDAAFTRALPSLAKARGLVFDLRGYPRGSTAPLAHLAPGLVGSPQWHIPVLTRPDGVGRSFQQAGWTVAPRLPRLSAPAAFLTDGRAISYAETYLGIVSHHRLAEIVGETTAGTNGNVAVVTLPGGDTVSFTGMKVLTQDGERHHGAGIRPTVPVVPTLEGIRAGRDEVLERAVELLSSRAEAGR